MRNEQQFQVMFADETARTIGADRYDIVDGVLTFYEVMGPATDDHRVASFPFEGVVSVVRINPAVEYADEYAAE